MSDFYSEWIVKRETPQSVKVKRILLYVLCVLSLPVMVLSAFGILVVAALCLVAYIYTRNTEIEWEYSIVEKTLNIDKIMSKSKRKSMEELDLTKTEVFAPTESSYIKEYDSRKLKVLDFSSLKPENKTYTFVITINGELTKVLVEPTDGMLNDLRNIIPRQIHIER